MYVYGISEDYDIYVSHLFDKLMNEVLHNPFTDVHLKTICSRYFILRTEHNEKTKQTERSRMFKAVELLAFTVISSPTDFYFTF